MRASFVGFAFVLLACGGAEPTNVGGNEAPPSSSPELPPSPPPPSGTTTSTSTPPTEPPKKLAFVAVTFNTGTSGSFEHDAPPNDGYGSEQAKISSEYYGDGLAWSAAIADTKAYLTKLQPDVIVFQEIFHSADCANIPQDKHTGYVCSTWKPGDPTVAQTVMGAGYQVACNMGKPDKCAAVKTSFGKIRGCTGDLCVDGLAGAKVNGCGGGSRVGRGIIDLVAGGELTIVNVHGSSGMKAEDTDCRKKQVEQVFVNLDGKPAANGARNLVMGDLNTDPGRLTSVDPSAERWRDFVGGAGGGKNQKFSFVTDVGSNATPTYDANLLGGFLGQGFNIDHIVSDAFVGSCWTAGVTSGHPAVTAIRYFDHKPVVCNLTEK